MGVRALLERLPAVPIGKLMGTSCVHLVAEQLKELRESELKLRGAFMHGRAVEMCGTPSLTNQIHLVALAPRVHPETRRI